MPDFELVKIEGRAKEDAIGQPWFTVSECRGRSGRIVDSVGFAVPRSESQFGLPASWAEIGKQLIAAGLQQGQRAIIRIVRTYPQGEIAYFQFRAE